MNASGDNTVKYASDDAKVLFALFYGETKSKWPLKKSAVQR
jgi:hypothetical protein